MADTASGLQLESSVPAMPDVRQNTDEGEQGISASSTADLQPMQGDNEVVKGGLPEQQAEAQGWLWGMVQGATGMVSGMVSTVMGASPSGIVAQSMDIGSEATKLAVSAPMTMATKVTEGSKQVFDKSICAAGKVGDSSKGAFDGAIDLASKIGAIPHYTLEQSLAMASRAGDASKNAYDASLQAASKAGETTKHAVDSSLEILATAGQQAVALAKPSEDGSSCTVPSMEKVSEVVQSSTEIVSKAAGMTVELAKDIAVGSGEVAKTTASVSAICAKQIMDESLTLAAKAGQSTKDIFDCTVNIASSVASASMYTTNTADVVASAVDVPAQVVAETVSTTFQATKIMAGEQPSKGAAAEAH